MTELMKDYLIWKLDSGFPVHEHEGNNEEENKSYIVINNNLLEYLEYRAPIVNVKLYCS